MKFLTAIFLTITTTFSAFSQTPLSPTSVANWNSSTTTFTWSSSGASSYTLEISRFSSFPVNSVYGVSNHPSTSYTWNNNAANPQENETFYWRVKGAGGSWSSTASFTYEDNTQNIFINIYDPPSATTVCVGEPVNFEGYSNEPSGFFQWNLPGATPSIINYWEGTAVYDTPGYYNVTFSRGPESINRTNYIHVVEPPTDVVITAPNSGRFCDGSQISIIELHENQSGEAYRWYRDGQVISGETDSVLTTDIPGTYQLQIRRGQCSVMSNEFEIGVFSSDMLQTSPTYYCENFDVELLSSTDAANCSYQWFKDGLAINGATDSIYNAFEPGDYTVVADLPETSCPDVSEVVTVYSNSVYPQTELNAASMINLCTDDSLYLHTPDGNEYQFTWFQDGNLVELNNNDTLLTVVAGEYIVETNYRNCLAYDTVTIAPLTVPQVTLSSAIGCDGIGQYLSAVSPSATQFNWSTGATGDSAYVEQTGVVTVTAINSNGCDTDDAFEITESCRCLTGYRTVGSTGTIAAIDDINDIIANACLMTGPAIFDFEAGVHYGRIYQENNYITSSSSNYIEFKSLTGNPNDAIIGYNAAAGESGIEMKTKNVRIKNLTIEDNPSSTSYSLVVLGTGTGAATTNYLIDNVKFMTQGSGSLACNGCRITVKNSYATGVERGGFYFGDSRDVVVVDNVLENIGGSGLRFSDVLNVYVKGNRVKSINTDHLDKALSCFQCEGTVKVIENEIQLPRGNGLSFSSISDDPGNSIEIINNMVCISSTGLWTNTAYQRGIDLYLVEAPVSIYHNSIYNKQIHPGSTGGIYCRFPFAYSGRLDIRNNIIVAEEHLVEFREYESTYDIELDNNAYYQTNNVELPFRIDNLVYTTLGAFRSNTVYEDDGEYGNPQYVSTALSTSAWADLHAQASYIQNSGDPTVGVIADIDGQPRSIPDMGADEVSVPDLSITSLDGLTASSCDAFYDFANDSILTVVLQNNGNGNVPAGFDIVIKCIVNGVVQVTDTIALSSPWIVGNSISHEFTEPVSLLSQGPNDVQVMLASIDNNAVNDQITQTVGNFSSPEADFNTTQLCQDEVEFENTSVSTGTMTYQWVFGDGTSSTETSPVHAYQAAGQTTVELIATTAAGCSDTVEYDIDILESPEVSIAPFTSELCVNHPEFQLTSGLPVGGEYDGVGVQGDYFNPMASGAGFFWVRYQFTAANGCSGSSMEMVVVNACTGVDEIDPIVLSLYPNPTSDKLWLSIGSSQDVTNLLIVNSLGDVVFNEAAQLGHSVVDVSNLASGVYVLMVSDSNNQKSTIRFVKE